MPRQQPIIREIHLLHATCADIRLYLVSSSHNVANFEKRIHTRHSATSGCDTSTVMKVRLYPSETLPKAITHDPGNLSPTDTLILLTATSPLRAEITNSSPSYEISIPPRFVTES